MSILRSGGIELDVDDLVGLGHHRDRRGRGVDAALRLGGGHALHAVAAGLELELRVGALARDARDHFLEAAEVGRARGDDLDLPAVAARRSACTCGRGRPRRAPTRRRRCRRGSRGRCCARRSGPCGRSSRCSSSSSAAIQRAVAPAPRPRRSSSSPDRPAISFAAARSASAARYALIPLDDRRDLGVLARQAPELVEVARRRPRPTRKRVQLLQAARELVELGGNAGFHRGTGKGSWRRSAAARPFRGAAS